MTADKLPTADLRLGDSLEVLRTIPADSIDAYVTDPPAGIDFMGKGWDSRLGFVERMQAIFLEAFRTLKPGAHALVWALPRTSHWTATALEGAGFEIRDVVMHVFGSGFPKGMDVGRAIDDAKGVERPLAGPNPWKERQTPKVGSAALGNFGGGPERLTAPGSPEAAEWEGWNTTLKPGAEHWILARKPMPGTVVENVLAHRTGALNVDACRIPFRDEADKGAAIPASLGKANDSIGTFRKPDRSHLDPADFQDERGRWPANVVLSHLEDCGEICAPGCPVATLDGQSGLLRSSAWNGERNTPKTLHTFGTFEGRTEAARAGSCGGASRFFYCAKPSREERDSGGKVRNGHPTVKPIELMRWLARLITPRGGVVLDTFMGSGTTGCAAVLEGFSFVGIERDPDYLAIATKRLEAAARERKRATAQLSLFTPKETR